MSERIIATDDNIKDVVSGEIGRLGYNADLNHIDVSQVTNLRGVFLFSDFNGDISQWDVSNVTDMAGLFSHSKFNGDISQWDVSNVENMSSMFEDSQFNGDISQWDVSNVSNMTNTFMASKFDGDISQWDVSNVKGFFATFSDASFNGDLSLWKLNNQAFALSALNDKLMASEKFGALHFLDVGRNTSKLHPAAQAIWDEHAAMPSSIGLSGPELGRAVWTSYQASLAPQVTSDDLVNVDFTMDVDWTVGCDPTASDKQEQVMTSNDLSR